MDTWCDRKNEPKTNPIRTQTNPIKAKTNPIRTQNEPNFSTPQTAKFAQFNNNELRTMNNQLIKKQTQLVPRSLRPSPIKPNLQNAERSGGGCKALFNRVFKWNYVTCNPFNDIDRPEPEAQPNGKLRLHTLKKNAGQNLADADLPLNVVQHVLGHSKSETTVKYYSQVDSHHLEQVRRAVDNRRSNTKEKRLQDRTRSEKKYVSGTYEG